MLRTSKVLYNSSSAGNGSWFILNGRHEKFSERSIQGTVTAGDTIAIQATTRDWKPPHPYVAGGLQEAAFLAALTSADITTLITYTADFNDIMNGPWTYMRIVKTGTTGTSKVEGMI